MHKTGKYTFRALSLSTRQQDGFRIDDVVGRNKILSDIDMQYCLLAQNHVQGYVSLLGICVKRRVQLSPTQELMVANAFKQNSESMNMHQVSQALYLSKQLKFNPETVHTLFDIIIKKGELYDGHVSVSSIVNMLVNMRKLRLKPGQETAILRLLSINMAQCPGPFNARDLTRAISILGIMDSSLLEVVNMLKIVAAKIRQAEHFPTECIADALHGLQHIKPPPPRNAGSRICPD